MLTLKHATSVIVMNKKEQEHQQQLELMKKQQQIIEQLEQQNKELLKKHEEMSLSAQKLSQSTQPQRDVRVINLEEDDEDEFAESGTKRRYMGNPREESSYLPMNINPEALLDKKKIIKKVRFHDDEPIVVEAAPVADQPKVGSKRLTR